MRTIFKRLYDAGLIYRAERLVNWSPVLQTAISDLEVKYEDVEGELVSFRYGSIDDDEPHIVVATTRVETMLGDTAIAVHPDDERYRHLVGTTLPHPFLDREILVVADEHVDPEFGTGAVKVTPAHDPNDFEIGLRHDLPMPTIMDERGRIADTGTLFDGMDRFEARVKVREALAEQGRIVAEKRPYLHSVGHSERSGEPIEPRLSPAVVGQGRVAGQGRRRRGPQRRHRDSPARASSRAGSTGSTTCTTGASRGSCGGDTASRSGTAPTARWCASVPTRRRREGWEQDPDVLDTWFSLGAVAVLHDGLARAHPGAGEVLSDRAFWSPATTSCSSGSPG